MDKSANNTEIKSIKIDGTNNRYMIKKACYKMEKNKKRVGLEKININDIDDQLNIINDILNNRINEFAEITIKEIKKKISGYRQQDMKKALFKSTEFITFEYVVDKMIECKLCCRYCEEKMVLLYDISREKKQWTVDRIDNDLGHNSNNIHLSCLECNLKRRRTSDDKYLFTKQITITRI